MDNKNFNINNIDYLNELKPYIDMFDKYAVKNDKLISCSPFRREQRPSFALCLKTGCWIDSGAYNEDYKSGNFIKLFSYVTNCSYGEVISFLTNKYGENYFKTIDPEQELKISIELEEEVNGIEYITGYKGFTPSIYLAGRGINYTTQKLFNTRQEGFKVELPVYNMFGDIVNVKSRLVFEKQYRNLTSCDSVFGYNVANSMKGDLYITESEIDAMYLTNYGFKAVALCGTSITSKKLTMINNLMVDGRNIVIATDNDKAGRMCADSLYIALIVKGVKHDTILRVQFPKGCKDINDIKPTKGDLEINCVKYTYTLDIRI
jgi:hypothetical protein